MNARDKFATRRFTLGSDTARTQALANIARILPSLPIDAKRPLEVVIQEQPKQRGPTQNALMWTGPLADISAQCWVSGRRFSDVVWHEYFKAQYLPEQYDPELCLRDDYTKWDFDPAGNRVLVGSTTELTVKGFAQYLEQIFAHGANNGVEFSADPRQYK